MSAPTDREYANKALIRRWFEEVWNQGRENLIDQMRSPGARAIGLGETEPESRGPEPFRAFYRNLRSAFPDLRLTIEDILADGDKVITRISAEGTHLGDGLGVPPTGRRVRFGGIIITRIENGLIAEAWNSLDQLSLLKQIGAVPASAGPDRFLSARPATL